MPAAGGDYVLVLQARFAWWRAGTAAAGADGTTLTLAPYGLPAITVTGAGPTAAVPAKLLNSNLGYCGRNSSQACIAFALSPGAAVTFTTRPAEAAAGTLAAIAAQVACL